MNEFNGSLMEAQIYMYIPTVATMRQLSTGVSFIQSASGWPCGTFKLSYYMYYSLFRWQL